MNAQDLILNIAVNFGRLSRFSQEGRKKRIKQFLDQTQQYLNQLDNIQVSDRFKPTLDRFKQELALLKKEPVTTYDWAEKALTWANILQHRAKLA